MRYEEGSVPILVVVPHARVLRTVFREDQFVRYIDEEVNTPKLAMLLRRLVPVHVLVNDDDTIDVNEPRARGHPFRQRIEELKRQHGIRFILDLHGMSDQGTVHMSPDLASQSRDDALSYAVSKYPKRFGVRPDVDLEFRRRARVLSTTCVGKVVNVFKEELLNLGFTVGVEAVYPGGDIIAYHSDARTMAMSVEVARRVREDDERLRRLALALARALVKVFDLPADGIDMETRAVPSYEQVREQEERFGVG